MPVLSVEGLLKAYKGRKVVNDVSLRVGDAEVVGLLGPNGAGKTTTFHMIVGLAEPDEGRVLLDDQDLTYLPMYLRARSGIGYLPQEPSVFRKLTVEENLLAIAEALDPPLRANECERLIVRLLEEFDIVHLRRNKAYTLSGGERRRLEMARALVTSPSFLLLDEPFAGIDPLAVAEIQRLISGLKGKGIGILITDHNVRETLKITDRAYIINDGVIFRSGTPRQLADDQEVKRVYLGEGFSLN